MGIVKKITAKITPIGKKRLFEKGIENLITKFSLGDSDANYKASDELVGNILDVSGSSSTTFSNISIRKPIFKDTYNVFKIFSETEKYIVENKNEIIQNIDFESEGIYINKNEDSSELNLLSSIGIPVNEDEINVFESSVYKMNAYQAFNTDEVLVYPFEYTGEMLTGEDLKITIGDIEIYSSLPKGTQDPNKTLFDDSGLALRINPNMVCLFSDEIQKPLEGGSWSDGNGVKNPYSNGKKSFNLFKENDFTFGDKIIGYVLLDKGTLVIINKELISRIKTKKQNIKINTTSISNFLGYEVVCNINRNEFTISTNKTHTSNLPIRVSEIGLYDNENNLIALAKTDKHIILDRLHPIAISVSLSI